MTVIDLYGLRVRSSLPLHQNRGAAGPGGVDVEISVGPVQPVPDEQPTGRVMIDLRTDKQLYTAVETDDGYLIRFHGTCDVHLDGDLRSVTVYPGPDVDEGLVSVLLAGAVLAFILAVKGEPVLHASAVQVGDRALGFVGASGMGKSTMATLMCADGAKLITDDLLRLDLTSEPPACWLGATELRLRKSAGELSSLFADLPGRRTTADERDALAVHVSDAESLPLHAMVVPSPDHTGELSDIVVDTPDGMRAFLLLSRFPRLLGWTDTQIIERQFQQLGDILDAVPVHIIRMPWGPPFAPDLAARVRAAVGLG